MDVLPAFQSFESNTGARVYRVSAEAFPNFIVHVFLVAGAGPLTLVDTGSGYGDCTPQLLSGIESLSAEFAEVELARVERIVITHGHIDHFGGLPDFLSRTSAAVAIHELDRSALVANAERTRVAEIGLEHFLRRAGVDREKAGVILAIHRQSHGELAPVHVDVCLKDGQIWDGLRFLHVPGHCPGQVCVEVGNILLSADHILSRTSPHQSPESIMRNTGVGHYLDSLEKVARMADRYQVVLGSHEDPIYDLSARAVAIRASHERKVSRILDLAAGSAEGITIAELTVRLYPRVEGFHELLALEEVGAHVEYLYERNRLRMTNWQEQNEVMVPFRYIS
jgi:glyoxylase-like metal-dependent hydrolase (beta-lactamase superfamily II)